MINNTYRVLNHNFNTVFTLLKKTHTRNRRLKTRAMQDTGSPQQLTPVQLNDEVRSQLKQNYSPQNVVMPGDDRGFDYLLSALGTPPLYTTLRINTLKTDMTQAIEILKKKLEEVYTLKQQKLPHIYPHPDLNDVVVVENRGPITRKRYPKEVVVDLTCGMAVLRGSDVFVQGILGCPGDAVTSDIVSVYADLDGKCLRGHKAYSGQKMFVGNGVLQFSREQIYCSTESLSGVGVLMTEPLYEAPSLSDMCEDLIFPQNLPSIVCSHVLDPQPGETILDMCASPGGKTTHIATLMQNKGRLVAIDRTPQKVDKILKNAKKWDLSIIEAYPYDSTRILDPNTDITGSPPYCSNCFDRILLDGPCSALGQRPSAKNKMSINSLKSCPAYQRKIIHEAIALLKPGGVLVYSTCTVTQEENEKQVVWMLQNFPMLSLESQVPHLGQKGQLCEGLTEDQRQKLQFYDPATIYTARKVNNDTIGFFIAKFKKKVNES